MKVVAIIPSRYNSSRFNGKPLANINGLPMIIHVANRVSKAIDKNNIYVATDDIRIKNVVEHYGYNCIMTGNCNTGTDRVAACIDQIDADIYVNVQGDEPAIDPNHISSIINEKIKNYDMVINCMSVLKDDIENTNKVKVVVNENDTLIYASRSKIPFKSDVYYRQLGLYAFNKNELQLYASRKNRSKLENFEDVEILRFLDLERKVKMIKFGNYYSSVDQESDIELIQKYCDGIDKNEI